MCACIALWLGACGHAQPPPQDQRASATAENGECEGELRALKSEALSDDQIAAEVAFELAADPSADAAHIRATVDHGVVALDGAVSNMLAKHRAEARVETIKGVRGVNDRLRVDAPQIPDAALERDVEHALLLDPAAKSYDITVDAHDGAITLTGEVGSFAQRRLAELTAAGVRGVSSVRNLLGIALSRARNDSEIEADVGDRLRWDLLVDAGEITVQSQAGKVELKGRVGTAAERRRAIDDAWVMGVTGVDASRLDVSPRLADLRVQRIERLSDDQVAAAVRAALHYEPRVNLDAVDVQVAHGTVTLRGELGTLRAVRAAEQTARDTLGVERVVNQLTLRAPASTQAMSLADRVRAVLAINPRTAGLPIAVAAEDGRVTLAGEVGTYFDRVHAEDLVSGVAGVDVIVNDLHVDSLDAPYMRNPSLYPYELYGPLRAGPSEPQQSDLEIALAIERRLLWNPFVDVSQIRVCVDDGRAVLTGHVGGRRGYDEASRVATESGAVAVDNRLALR